MTDEELEPWSREFLINVCKIGQGAGCCRYLVCGAGGFECAKLTTMRAHLDARVARMTAKGDNCEGVAK